VNEQKLRRRRKKMLHTLLPRNATPAERRRFLELLSGQPAPKRLAGRDGEVWPEHEAEQLPVAM
jgi:hypothetical protein